MKKFIIKLFGSCFNTIGDNASNRDSKSSIFLIEKVKILI